MKRPPDLIKIENYRHMEMGRFVSQHPCAMIYHSEGWKQVIKNSFGYKPIYQFTEYNGQITGLMPLFLVMTICGQRKLVGLPFSHYVPVIARSQDQLDSLVAAAGMLCDRLRCRQLDLKCDIRRSTDGWQRHSQFLRSILPLYQSTEKLFSKVKKSVFQNIRKAKKSGVRISQVNRIRDYDEFHSLVVETRKRQGSIPHPRKFFRQLYQELKPSQRRLYLASLEDNIIGGLLMLYHNRVAIYGYGASVSDLTLLRHRPNEMLFFRAIMDASEMGFDLFDFGITHVDNSSLLRFKNQWGAFSEPIVYSSFNLASPSYAQIDRSGKISRVAASIIKKMPLKIYKIFGGQLLKFLS